MRALVLASPVFLPAIPSGSETCSWLGASPHPRQSGGRGPRRPEVRHASSTVTSATHRGRDTAVHPQLRFAAAPPELVLQDFTVADLAETAAFHQSVVRPLSLKRAALFLQRFDPSLEVVGLSGTEQTRLLRALYRFQLYLQHLRPRPEPGRSRPVVGLALAKTLALSFGPFHPWEVEEIDCIHMLIRNKYDAVFDAVECDLVSPRVDKSDRPRPPPGFWGSNEHGRCLLNAPRLYEAINPRRGGGGGVSD